MSGFNETRYKQPYLSMQHTLTLVVSECMVRQKLYLEVLYLANIKSSKKRILVNSVKAARNKAIKSEVKTMIKKVDAAVLAGDKALASTALNDAVSQINRATTKGVYHKNTAGRKISRLTKAVNKIA